MDLLLKWRQAGILVAKDMRKVELLGAFFASLFIWRFKHRSMSDEQNQQEISALLECQPEDRGDLSRNLKWNCTYIYI